MNSLKIKTIATGIGLTLLIPFISSAQSLDGTLYPNTTSTNLPVISNSYDLVTPAANKNTAIPTKAGAVGLPPATTQGSVDTPAKVVTLSNPLKGVNSISDLIFTFMKIISYLAVIFGVLMLMWVGLQFVMARGNPEEIKKRSNQLLWIVVGIAVILGARILISVIINTLEASGTVNQSVIQSAQNAINSQ